MPGFLANKLRGLLRWALVTAAGDDVLDFPVQKVTYLGKTSDAVTWFPYGYHANMPAGTLGVLMAMQGLPEGQIMFGGSPYARGYPAGPLASGEVLIYHPESKSKLHFKDGGHVDLILSESGSEFWIGCDGDGVLTSENTLIGAQTKVTILGWGGVTILTGGTIILQGAVLDVNAANTDFSGNVSINGTFTVNSENYMSHTHGGVAPGSGHTDGVD